MAGLRPPVDADKAARSESGGRPASAPTGRAADEDTGKGRAVAVGEGRGCLRAGVEVCGVGAALNDDDDNDDVDDDDDDDDDEGGTTLIAVEVADRSAGLAAVTTDSGVGADAGFLPKMASSARAFLAAASGSLFIVTADGLVRAAFFWAPAAPAGGGAEAAEGTAFNVVGLSATAGRAVSRNLVVGIGIATGEPSPSTCPGSSDAALSDPAVAGEPEARPCRSRSARFSFLVSLALVGLPPVPVVDASGCAVDSGSRAALTAGPGRGVAAAAAAAARAFLAFLGSFLLAAGGVIAGRSAAAGAGRRDAAATVGSGLVALAAGVAEGVPTRA